MKRSGQQVRAIEQLEKTNKRQHWQWRQQTTQTSAIRKSAGFRLWSFSSKSFSTNLFFDCRSCFFVSWWFSSLCWFWPSWMWPCPSEFSTAYQTLPAARLRQSNFQQWWTVRLFNVKFLCHIANNFEDGVLGLVYTYAKIRLSSNISSSPITQVNEHLVEIEQRLRNLIPTR